MHIYAKWVCTVGRRVRDYPAHVWIKGGGKGFPFSLCCCVQGLEKEVRWEGVIVKGILIVSRGVRRINQFRLWCTWWRCGFVLVDVISTWLERGDE
jgi:hypothetical protein